jgi:hypothetical protein
MAGDVRPSPGYYVAAALLALGLLAGASLFLLLTTRPHTTTASVEVSGPQPTDCPVGGHAPVCYVFYVTNTGHGPAYATCTLTSAEGTKATFESPSGQVVAPVNLQDGESRSVFVRVVQDGGDSVAQPHMSCSASSV